MFSVNDFYSGTTAVKEGKEKEPQQQQDGSLTVVEVVTAEQRNDEDSIVRNTEAASSNFARYDANPEDDDNGDGYGRTLTTTDNIAKEDILKERYVEDDDAVSTVVSVAREEYERACEGLNEKRAAACAKRETKRVAKREAKRLKKELNRAFKAALGDAHSETSSKTRSETSSETSLDTPYESSSLKSINSKSSSHKTEKTEPTMNGRKQKQLTIILELAAEKTKDELAIAEIEHQRKLALPEIQQQKEQVELEMSKQELAAKKKIDEIAMADLDEREAEMEARRAEAEVSAAQAEVNRALEELREVEHSAKLNAKQPTSSLGKIQYLGEESLLGRTSSIGNDNASFLVEEKTSWHTSPTVATSSSSTNSLTPSMASEGAVTVPDRLLKSTARAMTMQKTKEQDKQFSIHMDEKACWHTPTPTVATSSSTSSPTPYIASASVVSIGQTRSQSSMTNSVIQNVVGAVRTANHFVTSFNKAEEEVVDNQAPEHKLEEPNANLEGFFADSKISIGSNVIQNVASAMRNANDFVTSFNKAEEEVVDSHSPEQKPEESNANLERSLADSNIPIGSRIPSFLSVDSSMAEVSVLTEAIIPVAPPLYRKVLLSDSAYSPPVLGRTKRLPTKGNNSLDGQKKTGQGAGRTESRGISMRLDTFEPILEEFSSRLGLLTPKSNNYLDEQKTTEQLMAKTESKGMSMKPDTFEPIMEDDNAAGPSSSSLVGQISVKETQPLGGPKYYIATNTKAGQATVIHEAMPMGGALDTVAEESGYEIIEYDFFRNEIEPSSSEEIAVMQYLVCRMEEPPSSRPSSGCCALKVLSLEKDEDNNSFADGTSTTAASTEDDTTVQSCYQIEKSSRFKSVVRVPRRQSFWKPRGCCALEMLSLEKDEDNNSVADETPATAASTEDDTMVQSSNQTEKSYRFKSVVRVPRRQSFRKPRWSKITQNSL